ncbi:UPF0187-domain-containing protein, partial [Westerdykella ornata]
TPHHHRTPTYPLSHSHRRKPRRLPLVLRFSKGAVHTLILLPVTLHMLFTALIVYIDRNVPGLSIGVPSTIIPSLSIVVGLMLVFRNSTSYDRFWTGRNCLGGVVGCVRVLARGFLVAARPPYDLGPKNGSKGNAKEETRDRRLTAEEIRDTETTVRALVAILYAIKHNLRKEYNVPLEPLDSSTRASTTNRHSGPTPPPTSTTPLTSSLYHTSPTYESATSSTTLQPTEEYLSLLPAHLTLLPESLGLSTPLQLSLLLDAFIARCLSRAWLSAPQASFLNAQVAQLTTLYGTMETIASTPLPIAHLIHGKQVLALYTCLLPFAIVDAYAWWSVPVVGIVAFTLYGIEGIGLQLEDPFGYDRNDIKMDGIVEDARREVEVLVGEWRAWAEGEGNG